MSFGHQKDGSHLFHNTRLFCVNHLALQTNGNQAVTQPQSAFIHSCDSLVLTCVLLLSVRITRRPVRGGRVLPDVVRLFRTSISGRAGGDSSALGLSLRLVQWVWLNMRLLQTRKTDYGEIPVCTRWT